MFNKKQVIVKRTIVAAAVLSVSACSSVPRVDDYDLSKVGEGILTAGKTTADVSERVWKRTSYLLGFSDDDGRPVTDEELLRDEVDLALMEEDAVLPQQAEVSRVLIPNATPQPLAESANLDTQAIAAAQPALDSLEAPVALQADLVLPTETTIAKLGEPATQPAVPVLAHHESNEDLIHEVASNETLWDIAKSLTGDANNWHAIADVNNLGPNAAVYPGQQLIIPGHMLKPAYDDGSDNVMAEASAISEDSRVINTQNITLGTAVEKPILSETESTLTTLADSSAATDALAVEPVDSRSFDIQDGESLWNFAKRTTGDATNWQAIAQHNDFTDKQSKLVRSGQSISVPNELVRPELLTAVLSPSNPAETGDIGIQSTQSDDSLISGTASLLDETTMEAESTLSAAPSILDETQTAVAEEEAERIIVEATFKAEQPIVPSAEVAVETAKPIVAEQASISEVMISGTYYPKAIYNDADFSSSLLMRVSPGTTLEVSNAMGNWYEVQTSEGIGYVHKRDIK